MADEQAGTLAFLQNFYTDVTLYMPFEAHERAPLPEAAASTAATPPLPIAPAAPVALATLATASPMPAIPVAVASTSPAAPIAPVPAGLPAATSALPTAGKLPALTGAELAAPAARVAPVATAAPAITPAAVPPYLLTTFATLGANAQGVVLLVRLPTEQFNKLPRNVFLNKLLQAINLVMADVVLVNVEGPYPVALANLRKEIAATCILAFGKNLLDVAVRTTQIYEPVHFPNQALNYLAGAEIEMVEYDTSLKKRLWAGLKAMFL